jgi:spermidine/putrescine ABC transporter ATP-binding subunit
MSERKRGPMIKLDGVTKSFGAVMAVDDISLTIDHGEFFALLGPSGCGKTTLLRLIAGFELPKAGEIYIDGEPVSAVPPNRRPTNIVFQNYAIFPHLNVRQNIAYGLLNKGLSRAAIAAKVDEMLALIRLPGHGERASHQLSGGQRQRVALARALVCQPKVLLLDEPLGALDKKLREEMQLELRQIQRSVGITFVFVTHDQEEALTMADRVAMMSQGRVLQVGSAAELYEKPVNTEVADFIGTINLFPGRVSEVGEIVMIDAGAAGQLGVPRGRNSPSIGDPVVLAVRPEKMQLANGARPPSCNAVEARLAAQSYVGDRSYFYLEVPGLARRVAVATLNARIGAHIPVDPGSVQSIVWPVESGILLAS